MRDPLSWSFPMGRLFGVTVRIHLLFVVFVLVSLLRVAFDHPRHPEDALPEGAWVDLLAILTLLFLSVLAHEYGHAFGARFAGGDCQEILMWPLGGLAYVDVPHTPKANFISTAGGPAVNLLLCIVCVLLLLVVHAKPIEPPWWPFAYNGRFAIDAAGHSEGMVRLFTWAGEPQDVLWYSGANLLSWLFWVNYVLFLLNMVLVGFPLDAGRLLQCILWPRVGYRQATLTAVFAGFITCVVLGVYAMWQNDVLVLCLCLFVFVSCKNQWMILETGGEDPLLGHYDFSQGYTSLERDEPPPPRVRRQSWWQRWTQQRTAKKIQRELEQREAEEKRMDELLDKIQRLGRTSLTAEEQRFLKRVSERYRNRH